MVAMCFVVAYRFSKYLLRVYGLIMRCKDLTPESDYKKMELTKVCNSSVLDDKDLRSFVRIIFDEFNRFPKADQFL